MINPAPAGFQLRRARADDLPALVALENGVFDYDRMSRAQYRRHLSSPGAALFVAQDGERLLGSALLFLRRGARAARLYSLATAPEARGRGVGRALLAAVESEAVARGYDRLRLEVRTDNLPAIGLYERSGYRRIAAMSGYYDDGADAVRYEKRLEPGRHEAA